METASVTMSRLVLLEPESFREPPIAVGEIPPHEHLGTRFCQVAHARGDAPAITTSADRWSYSRLLQGVLRIAAHLQASPEFSVGSRVATLLPNSPEYVATFYGVLLAGGVVVPVPPRMEAGALSQIVASCESRLVLTTPQVLRTRTDLATAPTERLAAANRSIRIGDGWPAEVCGNGLAAILFTSGSTGTPKGVMLSHRNLLSNALAIQQYLDIGAADRPLCVLPFHHAFGNSIVQSHLLAGANLILAGQTAFPETLIEALVKYQATSLSGVPDLFRVLLERTSLGQTPLPDLRSMTVAGGALRREQALEVSHRISPARFFAMYGQTEATARISYVPPDELATRPDGSIGRGIPGVTLEVVDEDGTPCAAGEAGELRVRGPNIMLGYWREPEASAERLRDGWLYTGDLATQDADGWVVVTGRRSALVKIAGFRVHPADLENFALRRLGIDQAIAVPMETAWAGTRLALFLRQGTCTECLTIPESLARCRAELPRHLVPELIQYVDEFPLTHAMKIDRPQLSRLAEEAVAERMKAA